MFFQIDLVIWALWDWCCCLCCIFRILILRHFSPSQLLPSSVWVHHLYCPVHFVQCPFFPRLLWSSIPTTALGTNRQWFRLLALPGNLPAFQLKTWFTTFSEICFLCPSASTVILIFLFSLKSGAHYSNYSYIQKSLTLSQDMALSTEKIGLNNPFRLFKVLSWHFDTLQVGKSTFHSLSSNSTF